MKARWALVVMGAWIAGSICSAVVATENFYTIDRLLASSPNAAFARVVHQLGQPQARELLRYLSSELNRLYFQMWNVAQIALGGIALWLIAWSAGEGAPRNRRAEGLVGLMIATVALMQLWLTPAIVSLGRELDFVPRTPEPPGMQRFWILHAAYTSLEMLKLAAGFVVAFWLTNVKKRDMADGSGLMAANH